MDILPDGDFLRPFGTNCVEDYFSDQMKKYYDDRHVIYGRCAHLTESKPIYVEQGRGLCASRNVCQRGCPYGGYFNANSTLIPWAMKTGNLTLKTHSVVHSIIYDEDNKKAIGVRVIEAFTKTTKEYFAKVIFLNASTLNTNLILLNSTSDRFPYGLGNDNGLLGKYIAFHNYRGVITATHEGHKNKRVDGNKPTSAYVPRFRNVYRQETNFLRGYAAGFGASKKMNYDDSVIGEDLYNNLLNTKESEIWKVNSHMMGETLPKESNQVNLDENLTDSWGIPLLKVDVDYLSLIHI